MKKDNCVICKQEFSRSLHKSGKQIYCSQKCRNKRNYQVLGKEKNNLYQKEYRVRKNIIKFEKSKEQEREIVFPDKPDMYAPFMKVRDGFGYEGVLLTDRKTGEVQCHVCGAWFHWLQNHIKPAHNMKSDQYKQTFGLAWGTALCSEKVRESLVKRAMTFPWERMHKQGKILSRLSKQQRTGTKHDKSKGLYTMEYKNKMGLCSMQIIDKLERTSKELGRQPYTQELLTDRGTNMRGAIIRTFGSVAEVRRILAMRGYGYQSVYDRNKITKEQALLSLRKFAEIYKRKPSWSDCRRGILYDGKVYVRLFGAWNNAKMEAYTI